MDELTLRYEALVKEKGQLLQENKQLKAMVAQLEKHAAIHCVGCKFLGKHKSGVFYICEHPHSPGMIVDPHTDFCSRRKRGGALFPPQKKGAKK